MRAPREGLHKSPVVGDCIKCEEEDYDLRENWVGWCSVLCVNLVIVIQRES